MNYLLAAAAGAIQGLTEFLPISSTGHLIIFEKFLSLDPNSFGLAFDASLHLGTLLAVLAIFKNDYLKILNFKNRLWGKLLLGTIPAAAAGLLFENYINTALRQTAIVALSLIVFSFVFIAAEKLAKQHKVKEQTSLFDALIIGAAQAVALIPGVSRSGSTISAGLFLGLKRAESAKFSFMLSGPIIFAAGAKKFFDLTAVSSVGSQKFTLAAIGIVSSAVFGYLTIKYFLKYLQTKTLYPFVVYRVILGIILLLWNSKI